MPGPLRPRFVLDVELPPRAVLARLRHRLDRPECPVEGSIATEQGHADLRIPAAGRRLWSPHLGIEVCARGDGARLRCLVGPNPALWTLVAFGLLGSGTGAAFLLVLGGVQLLLEEPAWGLPAAGGALVAMAAILGAGLLGRRLAAKQTRLLCDFLVDAVSSRQTPPHP